MFYLGMLLYLSLVMVSIQNCMDQFGWQDEVTNLKDQLQKLSSDVSLDKGSKDSRKVQVLQVSMQQKGQSTMVLTGEAQITRDVTKEVHCTCVPKQKKDQECTMHFSEQKGPSEKKPDSCRSKDPFKDAEELKEKVKKNEKAEMQRQYDDSKKAWSHYLGLAEKGYKQSCGAAKYQTFHVGNLSFMANPTDIQ